MKIPEEQIQQILAELTNKNNKSACEFTEKVIAESRENNQWYKYLPVFASVLNHPNSLVRNRAFYLLAANAKWDNEHHFDAILPEYLSHIEDEKPISARQCIKALAQVGKAKPEYIPKIIASIRSVDLSKYQSSMRQLIEKDIANTLKELSS